MFISASSFDKKRPSINDRVFINTDNIVYLRPNMSDSNKTEIYLTNGTICLTNNNVEDVYRLLNEFEMDYKKEKSE